MSEVTKEEEGQEIEERGVRSEVPAEAGRQHDIPAQSYGAKAVGLSFNPSNNSDVDYQKSLFSHIIDDLNDKRSQTDDPEKKRLYSIAITEAQGAQMWAVKAITW
jgi:hypothetical protein